MTAGLPLLASALLQIGKQYRSKDGTAINSMPANLEVLEEVQVRLALLVTGAGMRGAERE